MHRLDLTTAQRSAIRHVAARAEGPALDPSLRVTVNFHPDRLVEGLLVIDHLARDGRCRSQFETLVSNGGLTAYQGGDRWRWESRIFGAAYDRSPASERPVYGALSHRRRPLGGSHRFGSCHLRLSLEVTARTTFCYPDSVFAPIDFGVAGACNLTALADAEDCSEDAPDLLDDYVEAQVHGGVRTDRDVEAVVLDPSFRSTAVEESAGRLGCPVEWHNGFVLSRDGLDAHDHYRGPEIVELARSLVGDGLLTPRLIGDAARTEDHDGQDLKRVWHILARYGYRAG